MDWITGMQNAIDYIEEHITEKDDDLSLIKTIEKLINLINHTGHKII